MYEWSIHKYNITQSQNIQFKGLMKSVKHANMKISSHHKYIGASENAPGFPGC